LFDITVFFFLIFSCVQVIAKAQELWKLFVGTLPKWLIFFLTLFLANETANPIDPNLLDMVYRTVVTAGGDYEYNWVWNR
jgi:hypothetical protein